MLLCFILNWRRLVMGMDVWLVGVKELNIMDDDGSEPCPSIDTCDRENVVDIPTVINGKYEVIIKVEDIPKDVKYILAYYS
jgi:hypothetical protein